MHAMGDVIDMRRFRGLRHRLPLHLLDVRRRRRWPCRGSFRSPASSARTRSCWRLKLAAARTGGWIYVLIYWVAIFTAFLTAFYTGRAFFMTFWGPEKLPSPDDPEAPPIAAHRPQSHRRPWRRPRPRRCRPRRRARHRDVGHESPPIMTFPLFALAGCTVLIGLICLLAGPFCGHDRVVRPPPARTRSASSRWGTRSTISTGATAIVGTVAGVGGLGLELS